MSEPRHGRIMKSWTSEALLKFEDGFIMGCVDKLIKKEIDEAVPALHNEYKNLPVVMTLVANSRVGLAVGLAGISATEKLIILLARASSHVVDRELLAEIRAIVPRLFEPRDEEKK